MNFTEEIEKMVELSSKQPNGVYQNTDRIFTGIMERSNFTIKGMPDNILKLYLATENKADFESLFYSLTGVKFEYYLRKSEEAIRYNAAETKLRIVQIFLPKSNKNGKNSLIIQTNAPKNKIRTCLRNCYFLFSMDDSVNCIVNNLQEMGYIVRILYAPNGKFDKIKRFSCKEKYNLADYDMKYVLYHEKVVMELYNKVFCQNLQNPELLAPAVLENIANQLGIFAMADDQFCILYDDAIRFSLQYQDFRKIVNHHGYIIQGQTIASGDECYHFIFRDKLWTYHNRKMFRGMN